MTMIRSFVSRLHAQTTPRGRGMLVLLAVVLLLALATGESVLYRMSHFLGLVIAVTYAWTRLSLWRLDMWVDMRSSVAQVGGVLAGSIYVRNDSLLPTGWLEIVQMSDMPGYVFGEATQLQARGWAEWGTQGICHARGVYRIGPLVASGGDALGLFRLQVSRGDPTEVVVYPLALELPHFDLPTTDLSGEERTLYHLRTRSSQASTVHEYQHGENLNRIHWPSTARYGQLMSKEFDSPVGSDIWFVLDLEQEVHRSVGLEKTDEWAVSITASLARLALSQGRSVGLIAYGDRDFVVPLGSGPRQMSRILETLAWSKTDGNTPLANVLSRINVRLDMFSSLIVVTSSMAIDWVVELHDLLCRGLTGAAVFVDPTSFEAEQLCDEVLTSLLAASIPAYIVRRGDAIPLALSRAVTLNDLPILGRPGTSGPVTAAKPH